MATKDKTHGVGSPRMRSPISAAAILLGIYVATYLAVAGVVHVLTSPDAVAAVVPGSSMATMWAATPSDNGASDQGAP